MSPKVFVILPVHNRLKMTLNFVDNLLCQSFQNIQLILVDDGSSDGTSLAVQNKYPSVQIVYGNGNLWWGGGVAKGLEKVQQLNPAPSDMILIINDDTEIPPDFILNGVDFLKNKGNTLLLAQSIDSQTNKVMETGSKIIWPIFKIIPAKSSEEINCAPSRGLMFSFGAYQEIGPWIPNILPHYCSDYEFTCRALHKGFKVQVTDKFWLKMDVQATGMEFIQAENSRQYFQKVFSAKSIRNPWTVSKFILLSCPWYFQPMALTKIWLGFVFRYLQFLLKPSALAKRLL